MIHLEGHRRAEPSRCRGFTLIEMLIGIALVAIVLAVGVPSMQRFIVNNRLKAVNAQLVTDLQFARAEAAARNMPVYWSMRGIATMTCYTIFTTTVDGAECNCTVDPPLRCNSASLTEVRTTQVPRDGAVRLTIPAARMFAFDHVNGGVYYGTTDFSDAALNDFVVDTIVTADSTRKLRTSISPAGRVSVCSAGTTRISGYPAC